MVRNGQTVGQIVCLAPLLRICEFIVTKLHLFTLLMMDFRVSTSRVMLFTAGTLAQDDASGSKHNNVAQYRAFDLFGLLCPGWLGCDHDSYYYRI